MRFNDFLRSKCTLIATIVSMTLSISTVSAMKMSVNEEKALILLKETLISHENPIRIYAEYAGSSDLGTVILKEVSIPVSKTRKPIRLEDQITYLKKVANYPDIKEKFPHFYEAISTVIKQMDDNLKC